MDSPGLSSRGSWKVMLKDLTAHGKDLQEGPTGAPAEIYSVLVCECQADWALLVSDLVGWLVWCSDCAPM